MRMMLTNRDKKINSLLRPNNKQDSTGNGNNMLMPELIEALESQNSGYCFSNDNNILKAQYNQTIVEVYIGKNGYLSDSQWRKMVEDKNNNSDIKIAYVQIEFRENKIYWATDTWLSDKMDYNSWKPNESGSQKLWQPGKKRWSNWIDKCKSQGEVGSCEIDEEQYDQRSMEHIAVIIIGIIKGLK